MKFCDLEFKKFKMGIRARHNFENGYGVSIVKMKNDNFYELAILKNNKICYDNSANNKVFYDCITTDENGIARFLHKDEVEIFVNKIINL